MQTIVYQCDTAMPAQKLPNCCYYKSVLIIRYINSSGMPCNQTQSEVSSAR